MTQSGHVVLRGIAITSISNGPRSNVRAFANSAKLAPSALERV